MEPINTAVVSIPIPRTFLGRLIERLMILDAVLADRRHTWLGTENDKLAYFILCHLRTEFAKHDYPHITFGTGAEKTVRFFPDKLPIGLERDYGSRVVFLYLVTREVPTAFRMFLFRHAELLKAVHFWTIRLVVPRRFRKALALYRYAARDELAAPIEPSAADELEWVFRHRAGTADPAKEPRDLDLAAAALWNVQSPILRDQLARGDGRLEFMDLPHQYLRLSRSSALPNHAQQWKRRGTTRELPRLSPSLFTAHGAMGQRSPLGQWARNVANSQHGPQTS